MKISRESANAIQRLIGLTILAAGVGFYSWPAGVALWGLGMFVGSFLEGG